MTEVEQPIQLRQAVQYEATKKSPGALILYGDRLVHVKSRITNWCAGLGAGVVAVLSFALTHAGPGALGGALGAGAGMAIGNAITKRQAPKKAAAGGDDVTVIPLDAVTSVEERKARRTGGWRLLVSTSSATEYTFRVKPGQWPADLASALAGRGRSVQATASGLAVKSQSGSPNVAS